MSKYFYYQRGCSALVGDVGGFLVAVIWAAVITTTPAYALSLSDAVHAVWDRTPQLKAQAKQVKLSDGDADRRLIPNEPQVQYSKADNNAEESIAVNLVTAFPGKSFAMQELDRAKAQAQHSEFDAIKYDTAMLVAQAYIDCAGSNALVNVQTQAIGDLETLSKTLQTLYQNGHSAQAETMGTELQLRQAYSDQQVAESKARAACQKLQRILPDMQETDHIALVDDAPRELIDELGTDTADQARARALIDVAKATQSTALWNQAPDLTFSAQKNHFNYLPGSTSGNREDYTFMVGITVPIFAAFHEQVESERTKDQATVDEGAAKKSLLNAESDRSAAAQEYLQSRRRLKEIREKDLTLAEALVLSTLSAYRSGKLGFAELVLARKTVTDLRVQDIQLRTSVIQSHLKCLNDCELKK